MKKNNNNNYTARLIHVSKQQTIQGIFPQHVIDYYRDSKVVGTFPQVMTIDLFWWH